MVGVPAVWEGILKGIVARNPITKAVTVFVCSWILRSSQIALACHLFATYQMTRRNGCWVAREQHTTWRRLHSWTECLNRNDTCNFPAIIALRTFWPCQRHHPHHPLSPKSLMGLICSITVKISVGLMKNETWRRSTCSTWNSDICSDSDHDPPFEDIPGFGRIVNSNWNFLHLSTTSTSNIFANFSLMKLKTCRYTNSRYYYRLVPFLWWKVMRKEKKKNSLCAAVYRSCQTVTQFCRVDSEFKIKFKPFWAVTRCDWSKGGRQQTHRGLKDIKAI
jgi:hypothetical protein